MGKKKKADAGMKVLVLDKKTRRYDYVDVTYPNGIDVRPDGTILVVDYSEELSVDEAYQRTIDDLQKIVWELERKCEEQSARIVRMEAELAVLR
jgi:sugar lactone lactonase YvrE